MEYDVIVSGGMGFYQFRPQTQAAHDFVEENVDLGDWQNPNAFGVDDTRLAENLTVGMLEAGLKVEYNGNNAILKNGEVFYEAVR